MKLSKLECPYCGVRTSEYDDIGADDVWFEEDENELSTAVSIICSGCKRTYSLILHSKVCSKINIFYEDPDDNLVSKLIDNDFSEASHGSR